MQWGRELPVSDNTCLHCFSCLCSECSSFSSWPRSSSGVVFTVREGQGKKGGYLPPAWARSAPPVHSIQPSLPGADSQIPQVLLEYLVTCPLQQILMVQRFSRCWSAPFTQNRWLWSCQWKLWQMHWVAAWGSCFSRASQQGAAGLAKWQDGQT